ncbi:pectate lyase [Opitutus terrae]|uniref:Pectate lyase n=1 Tax=Opitutus terrae (strain DSM 11246 / JCM 15787 / PB90-1) TaxID=452637 RepID=B1ZR03_OPITP|nr:pectate lyase [Opitutus terrae]ACB73670.1 pectate lyase [Opitutus terrae PB90-1]
MSPRWLSCLILTSVVTSGLVQAAPPPRGWPAEPFAPLTPERIAALPAAERAAWETYWQQSERLASELPARAHADASPLQPMSGPPKGGIHSKGLRLEAPTAWYATEEARAVANRVVAGQLEIGGWPKGRDYSRDLDPDRARPAGSDGATFDNNATISELHYLAEAITAAPGDPRATKWSAGFERGLRYLFAAQYPHGGFPQYYPLIGGYHDGVTFNDDAMTNVLELLRDVGAGAAPFAFVPPELRQASAARFQRGVACTLATQLRDANGRRTVWCQQYDPLTLRAAAARNFEPIADASRESARVVLMLMRLPDPSPEVREAVEGAVAWFRRTALHDLKVRRAPGDTRGEAIPAPGAPPLWARFYEPGTTTPIFGDRDRTIHYDLAEVSAERIAGYTWYTDAPASVLRRYEKWQARR